MEKLLGIIIILIIMVFGIGATIINLGRDRDEKRYKEGNR